MRITNDMDMIDSLDIIARLDTLGLLHQAGAVDLESTEGGEPGDNDDDQDSLFAEERSLAQLAKVAADYSGDWEYGSTLIRDSYFTEYAQELAEDIGAIAADIAWPACHIDWEEASRALQIDYSAIEFDGVTYWVR